MSRLVRLGPVSLAALERLGHKGNVDRLAVRRHADGSATIKLPAAAWVTWQRNRVAAPHLSDDEFFLKWLEKLPRDGASRRLL